MHCCCFIGSMSALDLLCRDQMLLLDTAHSFPMSPEMVLLVHDIYGSAAALLAQLAAALADRENRIGSQAVAVAVRVSAVACSRAAACVLGRPFESSSRSLACLLQMSPSLSVAATCFTIKQNLSIIGAWRWTWPTSVKQLTRHIWADRCVASALCSNLPGRSGKQSC